MFIGIILSAPLKKCTSILYGLFTNIFPINVKSCKASAHMATVSTLVIVVEHSQSMSPAEGTSFLLFFQFSILLSMVY